jgi:hypothetical protein
MIKGFGHNSQVRHPGYRLRKYSTSIKHVLINIKIIRSNHNISFDVTKDTDEKLNGLPPKAIEIC